MLRRVTAWFTVERLTLDREAELCDFFKNAYRDQPVAQMFQDRAAIRRRFHWLNQRNPVRLDDGLPAWICLQKGRIVGHFGALAAEVVAGGKMIPVCWGRDLIVAPEARGVGAGPYLVMAAVREAERPFLVAGLNDDAYSLYRHLGFQGRRKDTPLSEGARRGTLAGHRALVGTQARCRLWGRQGGAASGESAPTPRALPRRHRAGTIRWRVRPLVGGRRTGVSVVRRTSATLARRYREHPSHTYQCFAAREGQSLRGVIVARQGRSRGLPAAFISEILAHPEDRRALDSLLAHASEFLSASEAEVPAFIRCSVLHRSVERALTRAGFLRAPSPLRWMLIHGGGPSALGVLGAREPWLLTAGDSDLDML